MKKKLQPYELFPQDSAGVEETATEKDKKDHGWVTIPGQAPSKSNTYRIITIHGHGSLAKTQALKSYEQSFYWHIPGGLRDLDINGPFEFYIRVYFTSMSHDLDNSLKCILDCLQYTKTIRNDNKCAKIVAEKYIDKENPRIEFRIVEV